MEIMKIFLVCLENLQLLKGEISMRRTITKTSVVVGKWSILKVYDTGQFNNLKVRKAFFFFFFSGHP